MCGMVLMIKNLTIMSLIWLNVWFTESETGKLGVVVREGGIVHSIHLCGLKDGLSLRQLCPVILPSLVAGGGRKSQR